MNKQRRKAIDEIAAKLAELQLELEFIREEEQEAFDNLPESLQGSERGTKMEECVEKLDDAVSNIEDIIDNLNMEDF